MCAGVTNFAKNAKLRASAKSEIAAVKQRKVRLTFMGKWGGQEQGQKVPAAPGQR